MAGGPGAIRPATVEDATAIAILHNAAWRSAYRGLVPDRILDGLDARIRPEGWRRQLDRTGPDAQQTWLIEDAAGLAGFATGGAARDVTSPPPEGSGEVDAIYLRPDAIGRGLGRQLLAHVVDALVARGLDPILVWVFEANPRARRFYEAAGFRPDGAAAPVDLGEGAVIPAIRYRLDASRPAS